MIAPTSFPPSPAGDRLRAARQYIIDHGWIQGALVRSDGCVCLMGALSLSGPTDDYDLYSDAHYALIKTVRSGLPYWNDKPGRTKDEVLAALSSAADLADREAAE